MAEQEQDTPEDVTETGTFKQGLREGKDEIRHEVSRDKLEGKLQEQISERPVVPHLLDWRVLGRAVAIAAILCAIFSLLLSPKFGAVVLILAFAASWALIAARQYNRRRPTEAVGEEEEE